MDREDPDVICTQEVPKGFLTHLENRGYQTAYAPMGIYDEDGMNKEIVMGVMLASKFPSTSKINYYHRGSPEIVKYENDRKEETESYPYIITNIETPSGIYNIATTHLMDTKDGHEDVFQIRGMTRLLELLAKEEPHMICGDFNMPRGYNSLYEKVTKYYKDNIPAKYKSSLDKNLHRAGNKEIKQPIFDEYMVDYIFTQTPYEARDVRLEFGVSDHAAVVANILKVTD
ncbi:MAG: endonuclease/exonuclease/phosphatase family protein [Candidatus Nomurabacteria bacterium]|nr:MAG: endonuclease/exonuclease/phosphatase family protein [Candidatus Nomurabacteria bacterium]